MTDACVPCGNCRHERYEHDILEGCRLRDDLGNRCACEAFE